ncbi:MULTISPECIES: DUF1488 family protein [unclassified Caballeronia]|uniref:DUF1488 family protein n=1 Tax=unclassified Caballeronia TaxID=2646786 RepID=UPI0038575035
MIEVSQSWKPQRQNPAFLANGRGVVFDLVRGNGAVECVVTLEALEASFWLEPVASDARTLKCFGDGYE